LGDLSENEFRDAATPSQEKLRRLLTLALYGNDSFHSVFTAMADQAGMTPRGREDRERRQEHYAMLRQMMMASQEQVAAFQRRLDRLERASYEALLETEEDLRKAEKARERTRERAFEIGTPDGKRKVYRDGEIVRDDDGNVVSRETIRAEDIPANYPVWAERARDEQAVLRAQKRYYDVVEFREQLQSTQEGAAEGGLSADEVDALESKVEAGIPYDVQRRLSGSAASEGAKQETSREFTPPHQGASTPGPG
jgi:hypothetical protein